MRQCAAASIHEVDAPYALPNNQTNGQNRTYLVVKATVRLHDAIESEDCEHPKDARDTDDLENVDLERRDQVLYEQAGVRVCVCERE